MTRRSIAAVDRVADPFFTLDAEFRFTYLNEPAERLLDRSRAELLGRTMWDEFPEAVRTQFPVGFHRAMERQERVTVAVYHPGLETWFETRAFPDSDGLSVYMRDVGGGEDEAPSLARHAAVVEALHDGVVTLDRNWRIATTNSAMTDLLGADRADLVGEHVEIVPELADIDDADAIRLGRAITDVDGGAASQRRLEIPLTDGAGRDRVCEFQVAPLEDETASVAGVVRDVTDRHEHERVVESLHEITRWLLESDDPEEICAIAVHAGSDLLDLPISGVWLLEEEQGYLEPVAGTAGAHEEFGGLPRFGPGEGIVWDVFEAGEVERFDDLSDVDELYNPETPIASEIIAPIGAHGVLMTGSFETDQFDETDVDLVSTLVENTRAALDRTDREQVLRERTAELERQTDRLESVAEVLSTDLKRQLRRASEVRDDDTDDGESVDDALERAERLVDDVRELARTAATATTRSRIELRAVVERAASASRLAADDVALEREATLRADEDRLQRLFRTMFDDVAVRGDGDAAVRVSLTGVGDDDRPRGFFLVDDASQGPPSAREADADPAAGAETAVDGPGLALVRAIAEAHGWTVSIDDVDDGTRVDVTAVPTLEPS